MSWKLGWPARHRAMLETEKQALGFPGPADVLRNYNSFTSFFRVQAVWDYAACRPGDRVLLIGDGGGKDYWYFAWQGITATVLDVAEQSLIPSVTLGDIGAAAPPFPPGAFDVIVMCDVLEHLYDDRRALRNLHALLRPGGRLVLSGPYWHDAPEHHVRVHSPRIIRRMLRHHRFRVERMTARGFLTNFYRGVHPLVLLLHYLVYRVTGRPAMIACNRWLYRVAQRVQSHRMVPYLDWVLFGGRTALNGYVLAAAREEGPEFDVPAENRASFTDMGGRRSRENDEENNRPGGGDHGGNHV